MKTLPLLSQPQWLLAFDFDGTLVHSDQEPQVEPAFFEVLETLRESHQAI